MKQLKEALERDARAIMRFATHAAQLYGAARAAGDWRAGRPVYENQAFLRNILFRSTTANAVIIIVSLFSRGDGTDVDFRRIRKAVADDAFMEQVIEAQAMRIYQGEFQPENDDDFGPVMMAELRRQSIEEFADRRRHERSRLMEILRDYEPGSEKFEVLKNFRNKALAHTTKAARAVAIQNGAAWDGCEAAIEAATLAQLLFTDDGLHADDQRQQAHELISRALNTMVIKGVDE